MGYNDLAAHYYRCGDLAGAVKAYGRTRDYCSTSKHVLDMCLNIIRVSIEMGNFMNAQSHVFKLDSIPDLPNAPQTASKLKSITGLIHLESGKFKKAAKAFLEVTFDPTTSGPFSTLFAEAASPSDIAVYGGLCALSSFDRTELQTLVFDNTQFRQFLELEPWVRELILGFYHSRYTTCFDILGRMKNDLLLDPYLMPHIPILYGNIRKKALIQYFKPFTSVSMDRMAKTFNTTVAELEHELKGLIMEDAIQARIDAQHRVLYLKTSASRQRVVKNVRALGDAFERDVRHAMVRVKLALGGLAVSRVGAGGAALTHEGVAVVDQGVVTSSS
jgi:COP9 signalosome complex subunit 1